MEGFKYVDIFATKGLEYLIVIGFLVTLVLFWRALNKPAVAAANTNIAEKIKTTYQFQLKDPDSTWTLDLKAGVVGDGH